MGISPTQLIIILVIVALLFGTKKLRNMGGDLGGAVRGFKKAMNEDEQSKVLTQNRSASEANSSSSQDNKSSVQASQTV